MSVHWRHASRSSYSPISNPNTSDDGPVVGNLVYNDMVVVESIVNVGQSNGDFINILTHTKTRVCGFSSP